MIQNTQRLQQWFDLTREENEDTRRLQEAWFRLNASDILAELIHALAIDDAGTLHHLWQELSRDDIGRFFRYAFRLPNEPGSRLSPEERERREVDGRQIYDALRGMMSGALAMHAARARDRKALLQWIPTTAAAWNGSDPEISSGGGMSLEGEDPLAWTDQAIRQWGKAHPGCAIGPARAWMQAIGEAMQAAPEPLDPSPQVIEPSSRIIEEKDLYRVIGRCQIRLLSFMTGGQGVVLWLHIEALTDGKGEFYPHPLHLGLVPMTREFRDAVHTAWKVAARFRPPSPHEAYPPEVRWWIEGLSPSPGQPMVLEGGSHGAAMAVALAQLYQNEPVDPDLAITATLAGDNLGRCGPVAGVREKAAAAFHLKDGRHRPVVTRLFIHKANYQEALEAAVSAGRKPEETIFVAESLAVLMPEASGRLQQMRLLCQQEIDAILQEASQRLQYPCRNWRNLKEVCVPMRVQRRFPVATEEGVPAQMRSEEMSWEHLQDNLSQAVVLGDTGHGKTLLLWLEVVRRCQAGLDTLRKPAASTRELRLAIFVRSSEVAVAWSVESQAPSLSSVLARLVLGRHGLREDAEDFLRHKIEDGGCFVALDAIDEVPDSLRPHLYHALQNLRQASPDACFLLTARPVGYQQEDLSLAEEHIFTIQPFNAEQMHQMVDIWFHEDPERASQLWMSLQDRLSRTTIYRSPLLLRLVCQITQAAIQEHRRLPLLERRIDLYERFLNDRLMEWEKRNPVPDAAQRGQFPGFLADVAITLLEARTSGGAWNGEELEKAIARARPDYPALSDRRLLNDILSTGVLTPVAGHSQDQYGFLHLSIGAYLAALSLTHQLRTQGWSLRPQGISARTEEWVARPQDWTRIAREVYRKAWFPEWHETIVFLAACLPNPVPLLEMLGNDRRDHKHRLLALAASCLPEILTQPLP